MALSPEEGARAVQQLAREAGFHRVGIAALEPVGSAVEGKRLQAWLARGCHGSMEYMARDPERRLDPREVLPGARSVICLALSYWSPATVARRPPGTGLVARYALGRDYHKVFTRRLKRFEQSLAARLPGIATRAYVDTGPVLEKLWAERAGLGWRGKHTNLLNRDDGSWLLLAEILTDLELPPDNAAADHCGSCTRCLDACPTQAITGPYQLDATRCISYLTIEHRGTIPKRFRRRLGDHVFGCDACLEVCPWNRFAGTPGEEEFRPRPQVRAPFLTDLVDLDAEGFLARFAGTAVMRAKREGLVRNACVALGNVGGAGAANALGRALGDDSALVREHAAWGLGRLGSPRARRHLVRAVASEENPEVVASLRESLDLLDGSG